MNLLHHLNLRLQHLNRSFCQNFRLILILTERSCDGLRIGLPSANLDRPIGVMFLRGLTFLGLPPCLKATNFLLILILRLQWRQHQLRSSKIVLNWAQRSKVQLSEWIWPIMAFLLLLRSQLATFDNLRGDERVPHFGLDALNIERVYIELFFEKFVFTNHFLIFRRREFVGDLRQGGRSWLRSIASIAFQHLFLTLFTTIALLWNSENLEVPINLVLFIGIILWV